MKRKGSDVDISKAGIDASKTSDAPAETGTSKVANDRTSSPAPAIAAANEILEDGKKKRGRRAGSTTALKAAEAEAAAILETMYKPEYWKPVCVAPANSLLALTGNKIWDVPDDEAANLAISAANCARVLSIQNPKLLVVMMAVFHFGNCYGTRAVVSMIDVVKTRKQKQSTPEQHE